MRARPNQRWITLLVVAMVAMAACDAGRTPVATPRPSTRPVPTATPDVPLPTTAPPTISSDPTASTTLTGLDARDWIGTWRGREANDFGVSEAETVLMADGSFTNLTSNPEFGSLVRSWGTWQVVAGVEPFLRLDIDGHEPTEFCGPLGCTPVLLPAGVSQRFLFLDRDTVLLWLPECGSQSCQVTYVRAG